MISFIKNSTKTIAWIALRPRITHTADNHIQLWSSRFYYSSRFHEKTGQAIIWVVIEQKRMVWKHFSYK